MSGASLVWFRHDLRLDDQPALRGAVDRGAPVVPVFIWSPEEDGGWPEGSATRWWLHHSLAAFAGELERCGSRLIIRRGPALPALIALADETGARALFHNRRYEPSALLHDQAVTRGLHAAGLVVESFPGNVLFEPGTITTSTGTPYQVFTPFWRTLQARGEPVEPLLAPKAVSAPVAWPPSLPLDELALLPRIDWDAGLRATWRPGAAGGEIALRSFLEHAIDGYETRRDLCAEEGTSRLSPWLNRGDISPRSVWHRAQGTSSDGRRDHVTVDVEPFLRQLAWREFAQHLLYHFPMTPDQPLRSSFEDFPWRDDQQTLHAWQHGTTGYPLVDAGMRQLWQTGWMHNRVRMVVASFLVKDLLHPWQAGARWFWDTLVDANLANNTLGWQWCAGCGADAAPFFRIFNPTRQGTRFDPDGTYVSRWVPELARVPARWIHEPAKAPAGVLRDAIVRLGIDYPYPLVDHAAARKRALDALSRTQRQSRKKSDS
jgi:deoxyribodipyrimidine photo-lyase